jgi:D-3-phosphoglycerate dehydrogenase
MFEDSLPALGAAVLKSILEKIMFEPVNYLNAPVIAKEKGVTLELRNEDAHPTYAHVLSVHYRTEKESKSFSGTMFGVADIRIVGMDGFFVDVKPEGHLLFYSNIDRPGMVASVTSVLAKARINIARLSLGRYGEGKEALTVVATDNPISDAVLKEISTLEGVSDVRKADL